VLHDYGFVLKVQKTSHNLDAFSNKSVFGKRFIQIPDRKDANKPIKESH
jgi:hypothetical protein